MNIPKNRIYFVTIYYSELIIAQIVNATFFSFQRTFSYFTTSIYIVSIIILKFVFIISILLETTEKRELPPSGFGSPQLFRYIIRLSFFKETRLVYTL